MHVHDSVVTSLIIFLNIIIFGLLWRSLSARLADTAIGKAMMVIY